MVEARCELCDATGGVEEFFFFASCKAEDTYAERRLFRDPNYDFCGFFSERDFALLRAPASYDGDPNTVAAIPEYFDGVQFMIRHEERAEPLPDVPAILAATLAGRPLVGETEIDLRSGRRARLEYPIKTMNVHAETGMFQVDTGPLPFPDETASGARAIHRLKLAFVAYNRFDRAEFILQQPTPIHRDGHEVCRVLHYADIRELPARSSILALP
jgi:hypothetical protein